VEELSDSSRVDETAGLVRTPEITGFWGRLNARVFSSILYNLVQIETDVFRHIHLNDERYIALLTSVAATFDTLALVFLRAHATPLSECWLKNELPYHQRSTPPVPGGSPPLTLVYERYWMSVSSS
jgi:hypothetical protein